jgi:hypothetical protein
MRARWTTTRAWMLLGAATGYIALVGLVAMLGGSAHAGVALEERKLPMKFSWVACQPNCRGWVSAVGIVTAETPRDFDDFAREHHLKDELSCWTPAVARSTTRSRSDGGSGSLGC